MSSEAVITEHELPAEVVEAIRKGRKIEAIKLLRERQDMGLANAQVLVDKAWRLYGPAKVYHSFADEPHRLSLVAKSLCMVLIVVAGYYFYTNG